MDGDLGENHMHKILVALPCLLFSGLVLAKEAPALNARGADTVLMSAALDVGNAAERPVVGSGIALEAAAKKKRAVKSTARKPVAAPAVSQPTDTSKRFNMTQDGKKMTADDFDAWMKKNGYRVATGAPAKASAEEPKKGTK